MDSLQFGTQITKVGDPLRNITLDRLYLAIQNPKQDFRDTIEQIRMVKTMNVKEYKELKKQLPYFVCGIFHPPVRHSENFAAIQYFMLDIDHLEGAKMDKEHLTERLREIPEVVMLFTSPGEDGLKIMFRLKSKCKDKNLFSGFYKIFTKQFAEKYQLHEVLDFKTSDATRACFLSYDPEAYFNPEALTIELETFITALNFDLAEKDLKAADQFVKQLPQKDKENPNISQEILNNIKEKLNPNSRKPVAKQYFVPAEVDTALPLLSEAIPDFDMKITETKPISYGRQIKVVSQHLWAELNIFYGKKGFKVVPTTKSGSNLELAKLAAQAVTQILTNLKLKDGNA